MTGPEHYREAERLLTSLPGTPSAAQIAVAQVHATLALAAATAPTSVSSVALDRAWRAVSDVDAGGAS